MEKSEKLRSALTEIFDKSLRPVCSENELERLFEARNGEFSCFFKYRFIDKIKLDESTAVKTGYAPAVCKNENENVFSVRAKNPDLQGNKIFACPKFDVRNVGIYI